MRIAKSVSRFGIVLAVLLAFGTKVRADALFSVQDEGPSLYSGYGSIEVGGTYGYLDRFTPANSSTISEALYDTPGIPGPIPASMNTPSTASMAVGTYQAGSNYTGWGYIPSQSPTQEFPSEQAFAGIGGQVYALGVLPGDNYSMGFGVSQTGDAVGLSGLSNTGAIHAFLYTTALGMTQIAIPNNVPGVAYAVNNAGLVVGNYEGPLVGNTSSLAFISNNGGPAVNLNNLISPNSGWTLIWATDINNSNMIAALGRAPDGLIDKLLLTPNAGVSTAQIDIEIDVQATLPQATPEPGTFAVLACGIVAFAARRVSLRRRTVA